jgi:branched-chain amino acid transport system ATP-binding protein
MVGATPVDGAAIETRDIVAGYAGVQAVRGVSLVAPAGRVTALLGANGAGKSTLMNVLAGLHRPASGSVLIDGADVTGAPPSRRVRHGLCYIPEGRAIFPSLSVRENILLHAGGAHDDPVAVAIDAFPALGERLDQIAGSMSGGQQQMLALARAWVTDPRYILLDEVSMGLAPKLVTEIFDFLHRLAASGAGLLVVEQYVKQVLEVADLVYVMSKGSVVLAGPPSEVDADAIAATYLGASHEREMVS